MQRALARLHRSAAFGSQIPLWIGNRFIVSTHQERNQKTPHCRLYGTLLPQSNANLSNPFRSSKKEWNHQQKQRNKDEQNIRNAFLSAVACLTTLGLLNREELLGIQKADSCGIVGFASENTESLEILLEGLRILQNRGYDSVGIATISQSETKDEQKKSSSTECVMKDEHSENQIITTKVASTQDEPSGCVGLLEDRLKKSPQSQRHNMAKCGIAHTRWATHGARTDENAHPHSDWKNRIALVHNGTIENYADLKLDLQSKGIPFKSETDSEVIANLIGFHIEEFKNERDVLSATKAAIALLRGSWALSIIAQKEPSQIIAAASGCPLVIARVPGKGVFVASEPAAICCHIAAYESLRSQDPKLEPSECFQLVDGAVATLDPKMPIVSQITGDMIGPPIVDVALQLARDMGFMAVTESLNNEVEVDDGSAHLQSPCLKDNVGSASSITSPEPYPHWTIREIYEQPDALARAIFSEERIHRAYEFTELASQSGVNPNETTLVSFSNIDPIIRNKHHAVLTACGTSLYACEFGAQLLRKSRAFQTVQVVDAAEFTTDILPTLRGDIANDDTKIDGDNTLVCLVSQSGETKDTQRAACIAREDAGTSTLGIVNQRGSLIARTCGNKNVLYTEAGREWAVASTKAFVTQCAVFSLLSLWYMQKVCPTTKQESIIPALTKIHTELTSAICKLPSSAKKALLQHELVKNIASKLKNAQNMFVLGRGLYEPIAREAALKIKEITYIHAEGCSGGALKHGPFALLTEGVPVVLIIPKDHNFDLMMITAQEVKARGAFTLILTDSPGDFPKAKGIVADEIIECPSNGPLTPLTMIIPLQLLAYELALQRGINPDRPRNLAKAVTVD